ncbi:MAG: AmmeMemoRadiSam system protein B [Candidatus Methanomethylophilus sp.]|nr:AmmeMemoRadiSam system protein B [Methanomethylophilus sp.]
MAGSFYPSDREELRALVKQCFVTGPGLPGACRNERKIAAVLVPHAGIGVSGSCAAYSFKSLAEDGRPEAYIVIGPDHYGIPYETVMCSEDYLTPLGPVHVHQDIARKLRELIPDDVRAHSREHSIEVECPFLQFIDSKAQIVPIIMSRQSRNMAERLAGIVKAACKGRDVVVVASSDLVHYVPKDYADKADAAFLKCVAEQNIGGIYDLVMRDRLSVCGYGPISTALMATVPSKVDILDQTDSYETIHYDRTAVVGYGSAVMYK